MNYIKIQTSDVNEWLLANACKRAFEKKELIVFYVGKKIWHKIKVDNMILTKKNGIRFTGEIKYKDLKKKIRFGFSTKRIFLNEKTGL